jgi:MFS family permease
MTMGFYLTYTPLWINKQAPDSKQTLWIGVNTAVAPLGIIFGYLITGLLVNYVDWVHMWRVGIVC